MTNNDKEFSSANNLGSAEDKLNWIFHVFDR